MMAKIRNVDAHYTRDLAALAQDYLALKRCPGGRPVVVGYVCAHCGTDTSYGDCQGVAGFTLPAPPEHEG